MLTHEYLLENLHYNPDTGIFTRIKASGTAHIGDIAGTKSQTGYIYISLQDKGYRAHRLAMLYVNGEFPLDMVDHINGIKDDNRFCNLRVCSRTQNILNCKADVRNKFGLKGVRKIGNRFASRATKGKKGHHLGMFSTPEEANAAYLDFVKSYAPDFARGY